MMNATSIRNATTRRSITISRSKKLVCFFLIVVSVPAFLLIFSFDPESDLSFSGNVVLGFFTLVFLYMLVSSRTVYRQGWWRTLFKTLWIFLFFTLMAGLIAAALLLWLIYTYQESI